MFPAVTLCWDKAPTGLALDTGRPDMILAGREVLQSLHLTSDQCPVSPLSLASYYSSQDLSSVFPNSASRHAPRERLLSPHSAHARAPLTQTRAPLYSKCSPLFRQVVWPWLESPDVSISWVRNKTQTREIEILIIIICFCEENKNLVKLLSGLIQSLYDRKSAKEILGFMIAGEVGSLLKNVSPSPVRGFPHPHFNVSNTEIQSMMREKARNRAARAGTIQIESLATTIICKCKCFAWPSTVSIFERICLKRQRKMNPNVRGLL